MTLADERVRDGWFHFPREIDVRPETVERAVRLNLECFYLMLNIWVLEAEVETLPRSQGLSALEKCLKDHFQLPISISSSNSSTS